MTRWLNDRTVAHLRALPDDLHTATDRYELRESIGRGGMGVVFRAFDRELEREVAVKVLHAHAAGTAARLLQEARILARLEHPGILPIHDVGTLPDGRVFYVMKLVRGQRLDEHLANGGALTERLRVFERLCDAVGFAHAHGVIHRDLKPENVMIGAFGEVLVLDWGVAKARDTTLAERGIILGTPGYMAPEQSAGAAVDERADIYALGGILAFLLTGEPRLDPRRLATRSVAIGNTALGNTALGNTVPRPLAAIVQRAQSDSPADRYATAGDLAAEVTRYVAGLAVDAYRESMVERTRRLVSRYRTPIVLVLAYLIMRMLLLLI